MSSNLYVGLDRPPADYQCLELLGKYLWHVSLRYSHSLGAKLQALVHRGREVINDSVMKYREGSQVTYAKAACIEE